MERKQASLNRLKEKIGYNNGSGLIHLLKKPVNHHFYSDRVRKIKNTQIHFLDDPIQWSSEFTSTPLINIDGFEYDEIIVDITANATIKEYSNNYNKVFEKEHTFQITLHAFVFVNELFDGEIHLLNQEQKNLLLFHKTYEKELEKTGVKMLFENQYLGEEAFSFFTRIWKNVDTTDPTIVTDSSHDYFTELNECHRKIMYNVCCSNIWGRYITDFEDHAYFFEGQKIYPVNLKYYDYRYVSYLESAVEELYTFYERLAYLMYLFLRPSGFLPFSLSYKKLFERRTKKEMVIKYPGLELDSNYAYFLKRTNNEHRKLSIYRHPLVHYQSANDFLKGSYNASVTNKWLNKATSDKEEIQKIYTEIEDIRLFINSELKQCKVSFEHTVLLIESLKEDPNFGKKTIKSLIIRVIKWIEKTLKGA